MNDVPPTPEPREDVDDFYRRASAQDASRPSEATRRAVLAHAERVAAERRSRAPPREPSDRRLGPPRWWRPAVLGTLSAAAFAALLVAPRWLELRPSEGEPVVAARDTRGTPPGPAAPESRADYATSAVREAAGTPEAVGGEQASAAARIARPPVAAAETRAKTPVDAARRAARAQSAQSPHAEAQEGPLGGMPAAATQAAAAPAARLLAAEPTRDSGEALRRAAETGDLPQLEKLLRDGIDLESRDGAGRTALMRATLAGKAAAVEVLLAHGADPNAADAQGTTPLEAARTLDFGAIAEALRRHGAP